MLSASHSNNIPFALGGSSQKAFVPRFPAEFTWIHCNRSYILLLGPHCSIQSQSGKWSGSNSIKRVFHVCDSEVLFALCQSIRHTHTHTGKYGSLLFTSTLSLSLAPHIQRKCRNVENWYIRERDTVGKNE